MSFIYNKAEKRQKKTLTCCLKKPVRTINLLRMVGSQNIGVFTHQIKGPFVLRQLSENMSIILNVCTSRTSRFLWRDFFLEKMALSFLISFVFEVDFTLNNVKYKKILLRFCPKHQTVKTDLAGKQERGSVLSFLWLLVMRHNILWYICTLP